MSILIQNGLLEEIDDLMKNYHLSDTARSGIGYKELIDAIEAGEQLEPAIDLIKQKSRNYAKRQITWFNREKEVIWINKHVFGYDEELILKEMISQMEGVLCLDDCSEDQTS